MMEITMLNKNNRLNKKKSVQLIVSIALSTSFLLGISGCQATKGWMAKRDDGSLAYQNSKKLAPLKLPAEQETAEFISLYPTPRVGANTLQLTNETGKQYQLPKPERAIHEQTQ